MTLLNRWEHPLSLGPTARFSPSGHALVVTPLRGEPLMQVFEIHFVEDHPPLVVRDDSPISPVAWASDTELVYRVSGPPLGVAPATHHRVLSLTDGTSRPLSGASGTMSITYAGTPGRLSVLRKPEGQTGLFEWDTTTGMMQRLTGFDAALGMLEVYPLFGHAYCPARQEVALSAWRLGDYLPEDVEPTEANSQGMPVRNGEHTHHKTPFRLFLLDASGGYREVPGARRAHHPRWSPDGSLLAFERYEFKDPELDQGSANGVWVTRRSDFSLTRLGGFGSVPDSIMHPSGTLFCQLHDETVSVDADRGLARLRSRRWRAFDLSHGAVTPL